MRKACVFSLSMTNIKQYSGGRPYSLTERLFQVDVTS